MKLPVLRIAALMAVLIIPAVAAVSFADGTNQIDVKCVDPAGNPANGVKITLQQLGVNKLKEKKSDNKGTAIFNKLDDGAYRVTGRREGLAPALAEFFVMKGGTQESVTLTFESGSPESKLYFEDRAMGAQADQLMQQGVEALQAGKFSDAVARLKESLKINPTNPLGLFHQATAEVQLKLWKDAEDSYTKAAKMAATLQQLPKPPNAPATPADQDPLVQVSALSQANLKKLPIFRIQTEAEELATARKFPEAAAKYKEAIALDPTDSYIYYAMAVSLANAQRVEEAEQAIDKALQLKPGEATYAEMKKKVLQLKENQGLLKAQDLLKAGDSAYNSGDFAGALAKYEEARPLIPEKNLPGVLVQLGRTYGKLKQHDKAIASFNKAIDIAPDNPAYRTALAQYYLNEKKFDEALNVYSDPRATGSKAPDQALYELAQKLGSAGNSDVAELALEKALKANPDHPEACYELGMQLYYSKKDDKRAKELLGKYTKLGKDKGKLDNAATVLVVLKKRTP